MELISSNKFVCVYFYVYGGIQNIFLFFLLFSVYVCVHMHVFVQMSSMLFWVYVSVFLSMCE